MQWFHKVWCLVELLYSCNDILKLLYKNALQYSSLLYKENCNGGVAKSTVLCLSSVPLSRDSLCNSQLGFCRPLSGWPIHMKKFL